MTRSYTWLGIGVGVDHVHYRAPRQWPSLWPPEGGVVDDDDALGGNGGGSLLASIFGYKDASVKVFDEVAIEIDCVAGCGWWNG